MTNSGLHTVKKVYTTPAITNASAIRAEKKVCLNNQLAHSLKLEAAMVELQQEFRNRSKSISQNVGQLGQLLGLGRVA